MITVKDHGKIHKKLIISSAESQVEILLGACNMENFYVCTLHGGCSLIIDFMKKNNRNKIPHTRSYIIRFANNTPISSTVIFLTLQLSCVKIIINSLMKYNNIAFTG